VSASVRYRGWQQNKPSQSFKELDAVFIENVLVVFESILYSGQRKIYFYIFCTYII